MTALNTQLHTSTKLQRLAAAKAALAAAETKQGLRAVSTAHQIDTLPKGELTLTYDGQQQHPKNALTVVSEQEGATPASSVLTAALATGKPNTPTSALIREDRNTIAVPDALATLLPHGLPPGAITTTQGSTHTALTLITQHTTNGGWAAIVGAPNINYTALQDLGADLNHIIVVPHPHENTPHIIAALIEGVDLLLLGTGVTLTHAEQRTITARNRERGTHIISQKPWTGARTHLTTTHGTWHGTNQGLGRLTDTSYTLTKTDPSGQRTATITTTNGRLNPYTPTFYTQTTGTQTPGTQTPGTQTPGTPTTHALTHTSTHRKERTA